jgi:hypothetical protein
MRVLMLVVVVLLSGCLSLRVEDGPELRGTVFHRDEWRDGHELLGAWREPSSATGAQQQLDTDTIFRVEPLTSGLLLHEERADAGAQRSSTFVRVYELAGQRYALLALGNDSIVLRLALSADGQRLTVLRWDNEHLRRAGVLTGEIIDGPLLRAHLLAGGQPSMRMCSCWSARPPPAARPFCCPDETGGA